MLKLVRWLAVSGLMTLGALLPSLTPMAAGQTVSAVPKLDLDRYMGVWYEIARYPIKAEKHCANDGMVLYALGDKPDSFQVGTSCQLKNGSSDSWNENGKMDKTGDGRLKLSHLWPFSEKYWVLATAPDYQWALVGSPNHKSLWVLSRQGELDPESLAEIKSRAAAEGFKTSRLMTISQGKP